MEANKWFAVDIAGIKIQICTKFRKKTRLYTGRAIYFCGKIAFNRKINDNEKQINGLLAIFPKIVLRVAAFAFFWILENCFHAKMCSYRLRWIQATKRCICRGCVKCCLRKRLKIWFIGKHSVQTIFSLKKNLSFEIILLDIKPYLAHSH